jgi:hypothetical protein
LLAAFFARAARATEAWAALEADLARGLLDESASRRGQGLTEKEQRQRLDLQARRAPLDRQILALASRTRRSDQAPAELRPLLEQRRQLEEELAELAAAVSRREVATLAQVQAALAPEAALVAWVEVSDKSGAVKEHWGCVLRAGGEPRWQRLPGSGAGGAWTQEDYALPGQLRQALAQAAPAEQVDSLVRKLRAQRLDPLAAHLAGVQRLLVVPVHEMAGLPVEALTDQYTISYTPSGTHLARGHDRPASQGRALLAVGDPVFPPKKDRPQSTALPPGGLLVLQVLPGGNAAQARVQPGDVLAQVYYHLPQNRHFFAVSPYPITPEFPKTAVV